MRIKFSLFRNLRRAFLVVFAARLVFLLAMLNYLFAISLRVCLVALVQFG